MAPTEGRFARPERPWDCRRGTPRLKQQATSTTMQCKVLRFRWILIKWWEKIKL